MTVVSSSDPLGIGFKFISLKKFKDFQLNSSLQLAGRVRSLVKEKGYLRWGVQDTPSEGELFEIAFRGTIGFSSNSRVLEVLADFHTILRTSKRVMNAFVEGSEEALHHLHELGCFLQKSHLIPIYYGQIFELAETFQVMAEDIQEKLEAQIEAVVSASEVVSADGAQEENISRQVHDKLAELKQHRAKCEAAKKELGREVDCLIRDEREAFHKSMVIEASTATFYAFLCLNPVALADCAVKPKLGGLSNESNSSLIVLEELINLFCAELRDLSPKSCKEEGLAAKEKLERKVKDLQDQTATERYARVATLREQLVLEGGKQGELRSLTESAYAGGRELEAAAFSLEAIISAIDAAKAVFAAFATSWESIAKMTQIEIEMSQKFSARENPKLAELITAKLRRGFEAWLSLGIVSQSNVDTISNLEDRLRQFKPHFLK